MLWFMNHLYNPVMRWILQSPFHKLMSDGLLLIAFRGRKSGKEYITPVQYICEGNSIWIMVGFPDKKTWWKNLNGGAPVRVCLQRVWQSGQAELITGRQDPNGVTRGLDQFMRHSPKLADHYQKMLADPAQLAATVLVNVLLG